MKIEDIPGEDNREAARAALDAVNEINAADVISAKHERRLAETVDQLIRKLGAAEEVRAYVTDSLRLREAETRVELWRERREIAGLKLDVWQAERDRLRARCRGETASDRPTPGATT